MRNPHLCIYLVNVFCFKPGISTMSIAKRLSDYLEQCQADYDVVSHPYTENSLDTAHCACIPSNTMAKAVVLHDRLGLVVAVIPANSRLMLPWLNHSLNRHLKMIPESALSNLFFDCQPGAIPAMGQAWGLDTTWESDLATVTDIYFEAGNHRELIHMHREEFQKLMAKQVHYHISCPPDEKALYKCGAS